MWESLSVMSIIKHRSFIINSDASKLNQGSLHEKQAISKINILIIKINYKGKKSYLYADNAEINKFSYELA